MPVLIVLSEPDFIGLREAWVLHLALIAGLGLDIEFDSRLDYIPDRVLRIEVNRHLYRSIKEVDIGFLGALPALPRKPCARELDVFE